MPLEVKEAAAEWALTYSIRASLSLTVVEVAAVAEEVSSTCLRSPLIIQLTLQIIQ
jgi:hypothetical protein